MADLGARNLDMAGTPHGFIYLRACAVSALLLGFVFSGWIYALGIKLQNKCLKPIALTWLFLAFCMMCFLYYLGIFRLVTELLVLRFF
jgi:hypothetical protein